jgi:hypothetical protein
LVISISNYVKKELGFENYQLELNKIEMDTEEKSQMGKYSLTLLHRLLSDFFDFESRLFPIVIESEDSDFSNNTGKITVYSKIEFNEYRLITEVLHLKTGILYGLDVDNLICSDIDFVNEYYNDYENEADLTNTLDGYAELKFQLEYVNYYKKEIKLSGTYNGKSSDLYIMDDRGTFSELSIKGLKKSNNTPDWVEYLIEGGISLDMGNYRMGFFNLFSATESFLNYVLRIIQKYYKVIDLDNKKVKYFIHKSNCSLEEKLSVILKEIFVEKTNKEYIHLRPLVRKWRKLINSRNKIAHGNISDIPEDMVHTIFTLIFSVIFNRSLTNCDWESI